MWCLCQQNLSVFIVPKPIQINENADNSLSLTTEGRDGGNAITHPSPGSRLHMYLQALITCTMYGSQNQSFYGGPSDINFASASGHLLFLALQNGPFFCLTYMYMTSLRNFRTKIQQRHSFVVQVDSNNSASTHCIKPVYNTGYVQSFSVMADQNIKQDTFK